MNNNILLFLLFICYPAIGFSEEVKSYTSGDWDLEVSANLFSDRDNAWARVNGRNSTGMLRVWCNGEKSTWGIYFIFNQDIALKRNMINGDGSRVSLTTRFDSGETVRMQGRSSRESGRIIFLPTSKSLTDGMGSYWTRDQKDKVSKLYNDLFFGEFLSLRVVGHYQKIENNELIEQFSLAGFTNAINFIGNACGVDVEQSLKRAL